MRRTVGDNRPRVKPVQKIELSTTDTKRRIVFAALFLIIGLVAIGYSISNFIGMGDGWTEIGANPAADINCANEFTFMYNLGRGETSATVENKTITAVYTDAMVRSYQIYNVDEHCDGVTNVYDLNHHVNEILVVDEPLYHAFETIQEYGNRNIYLGPIYEEYENLFYCNDEVETKNFDPYQNDELAERFAQIAQFARDSEAINVELLGDNQIRLEVSEEYLAYARENCITNYIDFNWMKNAFILDDVAKIMISRGLTHGVISSVEGFSRDLGAKDNQSVLGIYDRVDDSIYAAGRLAYEGGYSAVSMRAFSGLKKEDRYRYFEMADGGVRTKYLDTADGRCKSACNTLLLYKKNSDCVDVLMHAIPLFIEEELKKDKLAGLEEQGFYAMFCEAQVLYYTQPDAKIVDVYADDHVAYQAQYLY